MSLRILRPGQLTTVQDLGRWGKQRYGVVVGGAMDPLALRVANILVGNDEGAAALEMTLLGPTLQFDSPALIALCGGEFRARLGEQPLPLWRPIEVPPGSVLECGAASAGCRGYLAVAGGFDVPLVLGSRSTYLQGKFGGHEGRRCAAMIAWRQEKPSSPRSKAPASGEPASLFRLVWRTGRFAWSWEASSTGSPLPASRSSSKRSSPSPPSRTVWDIASPAPLSP